LASVFSWFAESVSGPHDSSDIRLVNEGTDSKSSSPIPLAYGKSVRSTRGMTKKRLAAAGQALAEAGISVEGKDRGEDELCRHMMIA
jgi:hypothetical protein